VLTFSSPLFAQPIDLGAYLNLSPPQEAPQRSEQEVVEFYIDCLLVEGSKKLLQDFDSGLGIGQFDVEHAFTNCVNIAQDLYDIKYIETERRHPNSDFPEIANGIILYFDQIHRRISSINQKED
jgi:hypothetical protein